ncbi:malic enzyme-like NAD(P)-binding protein, partial [Streptomyces morookaense]|uniref:malic enzyme-like NAD(P)-binding protein n=1 Tax=Streptomyces morookaense TaxID=1970 RepID=UPI0027E56C58
GAGAAGTAILKLLLAAGVKHAVVADIHGVVHAGRADLVDAAPDSALRWIADNTNPEGITGTLKEAVRGADVFIGVSAPNVLDGDDVAAMAEDAIVFALANPDPEVDPGIARQTAAVVATGRSDFPNQINNVLVFPGVFRGLLDAQSRTVNTDMMLAAARALADVVAEDELNANYIIPSVFNAKATEAVASAVKRAALAAQPAQ